MESGGVRIIYYYHDQRIPLYLLTVFGKNEKSNITKSERNEQGSLDGTPRTASEVYLLALDFRLREWTSDNSSQSVFHTQFWIGDKYD
jgi:hypothetical protein